MSPARQRELLDRAGELTDTWLNGNRNDVADAVTDSDLPRVEALYLLTAFLAMVLPSDVEAAFILGKILEGRDG